MFDSMQPEGLLPIRAITPELLNKVAEEVTIFDQAQTPPYWWKMIGEAMVQAANTDKSGNGVGQSLLPSTADLIAEQGPDCTMSLVAKLLVIGWRMAEIYLQDEMKKGIT
jgi:hypothetical protein